MMTFWLIRHALVEENARAILYGVMDVPLCETSCSSRRRCIARWPPAAAAGGLGGHAPVAHPPHRRGDLRRRLSATTEPRSSRT